MSALVWDLDRLAPIQRTLAIPLVGRARAAAMFPELGFSDPAAEQVLAALRFRGTATLSSDRKIVWGSIVRTRTFDEMAEEFATHFPRATAISLGVGLCTRALRVRALRWIEVDVPEVLEVRDALLPAAASTLRLAADLTDPDVLDAVLDRAIVDERPVLVLAEGLLMFLAADVRARLLARLDARLPPGSRVAFDYLHPVMCRLSRLHRSLRTTDARYRSGLRPARDLRALERLAPDGLHRFEARLEGRLHTLQRVLTWLAGSPLYDIACLRVRADR